MQTKQPVTPRQGFLRDIAITAVEGGHYGIGYWASCTRYRWSNTGSLDDMLLFPEITIVPEEDPEDFAECDITAETIEKGLALMHDKSFSIRSDLRASILLAEVELDACNIDAEAAECIVQAGLFGELVYG